MTILESEFKNNNTQEGKITEMKNKDKGIINHLF